MRALLRTLVAMLVALAASSGVAQQGSPANVGPASSADTEKSLCMGDTTPGKAIRADDKVTQGLLIHKVTPSYPKAAKKAHIEGMVILCADISKEGEIKNLWAVSGPSELVPPSIKAVSQWRYKPYLLNGEAVEVETKIIVNYALGH